MNTVTSSQDQLNSLLNEIEATDPELMPPPFPKEAKDKSLGIITDDYLKRIFSLSSFYRRESRRMQVDLEASGEEPLRDDKFTETKQKHETLQEVFWLLLRYQTNYWTAGIGIRKGWEAVAIPDSSSSDPTPMVRKLLGLD